MPLGPNGEQIVTLFQSQAPCFVRLSPFPGPTLYFNWAGVTPCCLPISVLQVVNMNEFRPYAGCKIKIKNPLCFSVSITNRI